MNIIVDAGKGMIIRALLAHPYRFLHLSLCFSKPSDAEFFQSDREL